MAKVRREKFDLFTLAIKGQLIGSDIVFEDDSKLEVEDFYIDYNTSEIHIDFVGGTGDSFSLKRRYVVDVDENIKVVNNKKKQKKAKKSNS
jgi:hypothetical protein